MESVLHLANGQTRDGDWALAEEAPLQLLLGGQAFAVMMMTPHDIEDFVRGFLLTEGLSSAADDILRIDSGADGILVNLPNLSPPNDRQPRSLPVRTSCGLCGAQTLADALPKLPKVHGAQIDLSAVQRALAALPDVQVRNQLTKSMHAAALVNQDGAIVLVREDVGRHNALDKLVGAMRRAALSPVEHFLVLSSRLSVELVQKAALAGIGTIVSVSAPTQQALDLALDAGMHVMARADDGIMMFKQSGTQGG